MTKFVVVLCCLSAIYLQVSAAPFFFNIEKSISSSYRVPENDTPQRAVESITQVPVFGYDWLSKILSFCKIFGVNIYNSPVTTTTRRPKTTTTAPTAKTTELPTFVPDSSEEKDSDESSSKNIEDIFNNTDTDTDKDNEIPKEEKAEEIKKPNVKAYLPAPKSLSEDEGKVELASSPTTKRPGQPSPSDGPPGEGPAPDKIALPEEEVVELSDEEFEKLQAKLKAMIAAAGGDSTSTGEKAAESTGDKTKRSSQKLRKK